MKQTEEMKEDQVEKKREPMMEWEKDWFDPETDLADNKPSQDLMCKIHEIGPTKPEEQKVFDQLNALDSYNFLNTKLNSPDSPMKKTGILFLLCREMLSLLKKQHSEGIDENIAYSLLWHLSNAMAFLLTRFLNIQILLSIKISSQQTAHIHRFLHINEKKMTFSRILLDNDKYENLPVGAPTNELFLINKIDINLDELKNVFVQQADVLPCKALPPLLHYLKNVSATLEKAPPSARINFDKNREKFICQPAQQVLMLMTEPFLNQEAKFMDYEQKELSGILTFLPAVLIKLIHEYSDLPAINFIKHKKAKPTMKWEKDWLDPKTDLDCLNSLPNLNIKKNVLKIIDSLESLDGEEQKNIINFSSYKHVNMHLNSPESSMKKTGKLFLLCQGMLKRLRKQSYPNAITRWHVLYILFYNIEGLLTRFLHGRSSYLCEKLKPSTSLSLRFFDIEAKRMTFTRRFLDNDKYENYLFGVLDIKDFDELFKISKAEINIENIRHVLEQQFPLESEALLHFFIYLEGLFHRIKQILSKDECIELSDPVIAVLQYITDPFMKYETSYIEDERKTSISQLQLFSGEGEAEKSDETAQVKIEKLIHEYSDLPGTSFFYNKRTLGTMASSGDSPQLATNH